MPKTDFRPEIDGFILLDEWTLDDGEISILRQRCSDAVETALDRLRLAFNGAIEFYEVEKWLREWIREGHPQNRGLIPGAVLAALDYYFNRSFPPGKSSIKKLEFRTYLWSRSLTYIEYNAAELLSSMAAGYLFPEKWMTEAAILNPVKRELERWGMLENAEIQLDLKNPGGGQQWLKLLTLKSWTNLKATIDSGKPLPLGLIRQTLDPFVNSIVVAYGYEESGDDSGLIHIYEAGHPREENTIRLRFENEGIRISESRQPVPPAPLAGFFCPEYLAAQPPLNTITRILHFVLPWRIVWFFIRKLRLLFHRLRS